MISESDVKMLAAGWLSIAGHTIHSSKDGATFADQMEGILQNCIRQAADIGAKNMQKRVAANPDSRPNDKTLP